jgi:hypothetical protein
MASSVGRVAPRVNARVSSCSTRVGRRASRCVPIASGGRTPVSQSRRGRACFLSSPSVQEPRGDTPGGPKWSLNTISTPRRALTTTTTQAMIHSGDSLELYTALLLCATAGAFADRTRVGKALSGPVSAMLFGALAANLGVLPPPGAHYSKIQTLVVSLATPCLLFGADLRTVLRATGTLSFAFLVGSAAVALASLIAFYALSLIGPITLTVYSYYGVQYTLSNPSYTLRETDTFFFIVSGSPPRKSSSTVWRPSAFGGPPTSPRSR